MGYKKSIPHVIGTKQLGNWKFYLALRNIDGSGWVQGSRYTREMEVIGNFYEGSPYTPNAQAVQNGNYDLAAATSYEGIYLGTVTWHGTMWYGELSFGTFAELGTIEIVMCAGAGHGWPVVFTPSGTGIPSRTLFGTLTFPGVKHMRLYQSGPVTLQAEQNSIVDIPSKYLLTLTKSTAAPNYGTGIITSTIQGFYYSWQGNWPTFRGWYVLTQTSTTKFLKAGLGNPISHVPYVGYPAGTTATTVNVEDPPPDPAWGNVSRSGGIGAPTGINRRRYHTIPEEVWFQTDFGSMYNGWYLGDLSVSQGVPWGPPVGYTSVSYSGDFEEAGAGPVELPYSTFGAPGGGSTFDSQVNYNWKLPANIISQYNPPEEVFIKVRRWKVKGLEPDIPRVKLRITTSDGQSESGWVLCGAALQLSLPYDASIHAPQGIGVNRGHYDGTGWLDPYGAALPGDDAPPSYPGDGGTNRVPDLTIVGSLQGNLHNLMPDSGLGAFPSDYIYAPPNQSTNIAPLGYPLWSDNNVNIEVIDATKMGPYSFSFEKTQDSGSYNTNQQGIFNTPPASNELETTYQSRYVRKGWIGNVPGMLYQPPDEISLVISGTASVLDGSYTLKGSQFSQNSAIYTWTNFAAGLGELLGLNFRYYRPSYTNYGAYIISTINGTPDPLRNRTVGQFYLTGPLFWPETKVYGVTQVTTNYSPQSPPIPGASATVTPIWY